MRSLKQPFILVALALAALTGTSSTLAQSKIQCIQTQSGRIEAPLAWQNTLGASRANAMCSDASTANVATATGQQALPQPKPAQTQRYATIDGEKVSEVLTRWAASEGYKLIWNAPKQVDLPMNAGDFQATSFLEATGKLINGVNTKIIGRQGEIGSDSKYLFPVEAFVYSDKVVSIALKQ